jgi:hypothetical protein
MSLRDKRKKFYNLSDERIQTLSSSAMRGSDEARRHEFADPRPGESYFTIVASSPLSNKSIVISQPPTNLPSM